jgi:hypothetical protein
MTTTPPEQPEQASPQPTPAEPAPPAESASPPAAAAPPPPPAAAPPPPAAIFAPVPRAPRVPWVNPARRGNVIAAAVIAAVVLIGAGIGIGYAVAPSDRDHHRMGPGIYMVPGEGGYQGGYYPFPNRKMMKPGHHLRQVPQPPAKTVPAKPSGSATS